MPIRSEARLLVVDEPQTTERRDGAFHRDRSRDKGKWCRDTASDEPPRPTVEAEGVGRRFVPLFRERMR
jgi:hypothetical protein